jgi:hypothetical protein
MFRLLMTVMIASVLIGAVTVGTFAAFGDTEKDIDNLITAATVDLEIAPGSHCEVVDIIPGEDIDWDGEDDCVTELTNGGDSAIDVYLEVVLTPAACDPSDNGADGEVPGADDGSQYCDDGEDITGSEVSLDLALFGATSLLDDGEAYNLAGVPDPPLLGDLGEVEGAGCVLIGTLAGDAFADFSFDGTLDDVGNTAQGDALTIDLYFAAVQAGEAAPADCGAPAPE